MDLKMLQQLHISSRTVDGVIKDARCEIKDVVNEQEEVFFSDLNHPRHAT